MLHPGIVFHRVKVYSLTADGGWDDTGTGLVSLEPLEVSSSSVRRARARAAPSRPAASAAALHHHGVVTDMQVAAHTPWRRVSLSIADDFALLPPKPIATTTQAHLDDDDAAPPLGLVVLGEENHRTLLVHRVSHEDIYHRQGERARARARAMAARRRRSRPPSPPPPSHPV